MGVDRSRKLEKAFPGAQDQRALAEASLRGPRTQDVRKGFRPGRLVSGTGMCRARRRNQPAVLPSEDQGPLPRLALRVQFSSSQARQWN